MEKSLTPEPAPALHAPNAHALLPDAAVYEQQETGAGLSWRVEPGTLKPELWLTCDLLTESQAYGTFRLRLFEAGHDQPFVLLFALLPRVQARMRLPLDCTDLNRWQLGREAAWLKPMCWGQAVDVTRVDRMELALERKPAGAFRWQMTPLVLTERKPDRLTDPLLPNGPLLDALGQSTQQDWPGKVISEEAVVHDLHRQCDEAKHAAWPSTWSRFGGDTSGPQFEATGYFRTEHDGQRWWLVDPEGWPFWSAGVDCVGPGIETEATGLAPALSWLPTSDSEFAEARHSSRPGHLRVDYLKANLIRAFGETWREAWRVLAYAQMKAIGFNTVGNWSDTQASREQQFPYVRPMGSPYRTVPMVFRDFPDVYDERFDADAATFAKGLRDTADDPAMIGYFLMNEPTWGFADQTPAEGMLLNTEEAACRSALVAWLKEQHGDDLSAAWQSDLTLAEVERGRLAASRITAAARADLIAFSEIMVRKLFDTLCDACEAVDPNHLNLGCRYYTAPPAWAREGMKRFDVFSINCYQPTIDHEAVAKIVDALDRPVMIGEWHFGALDAGLPASGIGHVPTQAGRGKAYRRYLEDAAADANCVGVHWFTLYDQSAMGRFDGEAYNIGFLDVCHQPYGELAEAARAGHEALYAVVRGQTPAYPQAPEYLPKVFV